MKKSIVRNIVLVIITICFMGMVFNNNTCSAKVSNEVQDQMNNARLRSLEVVGQTLSPAFNPYTNNYYVIVPEDIDYLDVNAETEEEGASYKVSGNSNIGAAENIIKVVVTSESRRTNTYNIYVTQRGDRGLNLSALSIKDATMTPEFNPNVYSYTATIDTFDVGPFNITATPANEAANVEIIGNGEGEIKEGKNNITIIVSDGENRNVYEIEVTLNKKLTSISQVASSNKILVFFQGVGDKMAEGFKHFREWLENFINNNDNALPILAGCAAVLLVLVIFLFTRVIKKFKANKKRDKIKERAKK